jgi:hypothetical protein
MKWAEFIFEPSVGDILSKSDFLLTLRFRFPRLRIVLKNGNQTFSPRAGGMSMATKKPSSAPFVFFYCFLILMVSRIIVSLLERGGGV